MQDNLNNKKRVLISFIGRGSYDKNNKYETVIYDFGNNYKIEKSFFGAALYEYLEKIGQNVDQWLIIGTKNSMWSEIATTFNFYEENFDSIFPLQEKVKGEEFDLSKGLSDVLFNEWVKLIRSYKSNVSLLMVDPLNNEIYINSLLNLLDKQTEYEVIIDITHAFRFMPVVLSYSIMLAKKLRKINNVKVYYGSLELTPRSEKIKPVIDISIISKMVSLTEALSIYQNSGYFPVVLDNLNIDNSDKIYFKIETNRSINDDLRILLNEMEEKKSSEDIYINEIIDLVADELSKLKNSRYLDERMIERADYFYFRNQYLKSLVLIYEALLIAIGRKLKGIGYKDFIDFKADEFEWRDKVRRLIWNELNNYTDSKYEKNIIVKSGNIYNIIFALFNIRNCVIHGSIPRDIKTKLISQSEIDSYLHSFNKFDNLYKQVRTLLYDINS
ncbi:TIGR02221 family CRISPR-associated protein [Caldicellulosiruptoraceae bacterium PP1]